MTGSQWKKQNCSKTMHWWIGQNNAFCLVGWPQSNKMHSFTNFFQNAQQRPKSSLAFYAFLSIVLSSLKLPDFNFNWSFVLPHFCSICYSSSLQSKGSLGCKLRFILPPPKDSWQNPLLKHLVHKVGIKFP